jgi:hypothetical protein
MHAPPTRPVVEANVAFENPAEMFLAEHDLVERKKGTPTESTRGLLSGSEPGTQ